MKLFEYSAASGVPITKAVEQAMSTPHMNVPDISASIYSGLIYITTGSIMKRLVTEAGKGNGLEIWRLIYREWKSKSPQVMTTFRTAYEQPVKCKTKEDVRRRLAEWLHFGSEYETVTGYKFGEHGNLEALKRFLPDEMAREVER